MNLDRYRLVLPAVGLGLILSGSSTTPSHAQGLSSGSGSGYGTGSSAGSAGATGTGTESSSGLGTTSGRGFFRPGYNREQGPGNLLTDPGITPRVVVPGLSEDFFGPGEALALLRDARLITDPGERSLAMVRIARSSISLGRPDLGHIAMFQAARDSELETNQTLRDQRLVNVVLTALDLAEEHLRDIVVIGAGPEGLPVPLPPRKTDRASNFERARQEWELAFNLSFEVSNLSARTETLFQVVDRQSLGSNLLIREPFRESGGLPDPSSPTITAQTRDFADAMLVSAIDKALKIERPVWRDRGLVAIATNAATSGQFDRAIQAARSIPQPEIRTDGLLRVAQDLAIHNKGERSTEIYSETARTISTIPQPDARETLVGVLIDSLIAFGRFDDARAATVLYSKPANRPIALAAVARSQGLRKLADSARAWIEKEPDPALRSLLYRMLNEGVLTDDEQRKSSEGYRPSS